jgi:O-antigen/teichoic acid export membrane protein
MPAGDGAAVAMDAGFVKGSIGSRLIGGSAAGAVGFGLSVLQAVLQVPLLLQVWSAETFAVWMGVQGLFGLMTSVDVGFHAFVGAEVNMLGGARPVEVRRLLSSAMRMTTASAAIQVAACAIAVMIGGTGLHPVSDYLAEVGVPLLALSLYWLAAGTQNGLLCRLYLAYGETVRYQLFGVAQKACTFLAVIATAWCGGGVAEVATAFAMAAAGTSVLNILDLKVRRPAVYPHWSLGDWRSAWSALRQSLGISLSMFLDQTANGGLAAFVSATLPATGAAQFSTVRSLTNAVTQASGIVMFPAVPELGRDATPSRIGRAALLIDALMVVCVTPLAMATTLVASWVPELYRTWTRGVLDFDASVFIALAAAVLVRQLGMPFQLFLIATNRVRSQFTATCLRAGILGAGVAVLAPTGGAAGIATGLLLAETVVSGYAFAATAADFKRYAGCLSGGHAGLALLHVITALLVMFATFRPGVSAALPCGIGCLVHLGIAAAQARGVPAFLRQRLADWWAGRAAVCVPDAPGRANP